MENLTKDVEKNNVKTSQQITAEFLNSLQKQFTGMTTKEVYHTISETERIRKEASAL